MKFNITASPLGYLYVAAKGRLDLESGMEMVASAAASAEKEKATGFLFDLKDSIIGLQLSEVRYLLDRMQISGLIQLSKICFVCSQDDDEYLYITDEGEKRGFEIRCFKRTAEALAWLLERPTSIA